MIIIERRRNKWKVITSVYVLAVVLLGMLVVDNFVKGQAVGSRVNTGFKSSIQGSCLGVRG